MGIRNIKLTIEYDGTRYPGWQSPKKNNNAAISGKIGEVLRRMTGEEVALFCGEKTGPGVHALQQIVNFKTSCRIPEEEIRQYLNQYLPLDIAVCDVAEVSERFHAELNPHKITYRYGMLIGDTEDVFRRRYVDYRTDVPNIEQMEKAAGQLKGYHDFKAFSAGKTKKSTEREIADLQIFSSSLDVQYPDGHVCNADRFFQPEGLGPEYKTVYIMIKANDFLKQMPQKIIGTLLDIGYGKRKAASIEHIFGGSEPASADCINHALFLEEVTYEEE